MNRNILAALFLGVTIGPVIAAENDAKTVRDAVRQIGTEWDSLPKNSDLNVLRGRSQMAVRTVSRLGESAVPEVEKALHDTATSPQVRGVLCEALGDLPGDSSVELLGKILSDPTQHPVVRAFAGRAIVKKKGARADAIIKRAVADASLSDGVRSELMMNTAARGLDDVDWLAQVAEGKGINLPADSKAVISQDAYTLILNAQRALGASNNPRATEVIIAFLEKYPTNSILIEALGNRNDPRAIPILLKCLKTPTQNTSVQDAATALGKLHAKEAVDPLIDIMLHNSGMFEIQAAVSALAEIGDRRALPPLEHFVENMKHDPRYAKIYPQLLLESQKGWGEIPPILKALDKLKTK